MHVQVASATADYGQISQKRNISTSEMKRFSHFVPCDLELRPLDLKCAPQLFLSSTMFTINFTPNQTDGVQRLMRPIERAT